MCIATKYYNAIVVRGVNPMGQGDMSPIFEIYLNSVNCTKFGQSILGKIVKTVAIRCHILRLKCTKFDFGWCSAHTLLWELQLALPMSPT